MLPSAGQAPTNLTFSEKDVPALIRFDIVIFVGALAPVRFSVADFENAIEENRAREIIERVTNFNMFFISVSNFHKDTHKVHSEQNESIVKSVTSKKIAIFMTEMILTIWETEK